MNKENRIKKFKEKYPKNPKQIREDLKILYGFNKQTK